MMRTVPVTVTLDGKTKIKALEVRCPNCDGASFRLISLTPGGHSEPHTHMGCRRCGRWYCNTNQGLTCEVAQA